MIVNSRRVKKLTNLQYLRTNRIIIMNFVDNEFFESYMSTDHLTTTPVLKHLKGYGKYGLKLNRTM